MSDSAIDALIRVLNRRRGSAIQRTIAADLGFQPAKLSRYKTAGLKSRAAWEALWDGVYEVAYRAGQAEASSRAMKAVLATFGEIPQDQLASKLGVCQTTVSTWVRGHSLPRRQNLEKLLGLYAARLAEPIVEFEPIDPVPTGPTAWAMCADAGENDALRLTLRGRVGIYVFYDSAGRVTYLGKSTRDLWDEAKQRLKAKVNRPFYNPKKTRGVQQGEVARYVSAYWVRVPAAIHNLEVLMLRAFPNDLANTNVGEFKEDL